MKVGFIGTGKMGEAIIASLATSRGKYGIFACEINAERGQEIKRRYGVNVYTHSISVLESTNVIFLAVKPQDLDKVLEEMAPHVTKDHLLISIAAGKPIARIESVIRKGKVVRVMPNLATLVSEGMSVFCTGKRVTNQDKTTVEILLSCFGKVLELPEEKFDAVTALSGSGPAFFAYLLDLMVKAAVKEGLERKDAIMLAEQTMLGTSKLLIEKNLEPEELVDSVTSPNGTTAAGMAHLRKIEVSKIIGHTIIAAAKRSRELSK